MQLLSFSEIAISQRTCLVVSRSMSKSSGLGNTEGSRFAISIAAMTPSPALMVSPPMDMSPLAIRRRPRCVMVTIYRYPHCKTHPGQPHLRTSQGLRRRCDGRASYGHIEACVTWRAWAMAERGGVSRTPLGEGVFE